MRSAATGPVRPDSVRSRASSPARVSMMLPSAPAGSSVTSAARKANCKVPSAPRVITRSCQAPSAKANCRIGSASRNSFARISAGPSGTAARSSCQRGGDAVSPATAAACAARKGLLSSTKSRWAAAWNGATARCTVRSTSRISVPRPGPSSISRTGSGDPICCQVTAHHSPISSPKTWLISGAVTKSPAVPMVAARCQ